MLLARVWFRFCLMFNRGHWDGSRGRYTCWPVISQATCVSSVPGICTYCCTLLQCLLCPRHSTMSARTLCFRADVRPPSSSVCSSGQILLPRYLMNGSSNIDETYREYSLAHHTDDLVIFWKLQVKVTAGRWGGEGIHADAGTSKSIF